MDISLPSVGQALEFFQHWPDVTILLGSSAFGNVLTIALEWWFLPTVNEPDAKRRQKGLTFLFCWAVSAAASYLLWTEIDPADPPGMRLIVSVVAGALGFFAYPPLARLLTDKFPAIGSAWDGLRGEK
jgi:hypothetical protein